MKLLTRLLLVLIAAVPAMGVAAQQESLSKQEKAQKSFRELHRRMQKLQVVLQETDPTESKILAAGNRYIQEAKINEDMTKIRRLLQEERWDEAQVEMSSVHKELVKLMELLLSKDADLQRLLEEIAALEEWKAQVEDLIQDQTKEKNDSAKVQELQEHLEEIAKAKAEVEAIIAEQKALRDATNKADMNLADGDAEQMANREGEIQERTEGLLAIHVASIYPLLYRLERRRLMHF